MIQEVGVHCQCYNQMFANVLCCCGMGVDGNLSPMLVDHIRNRFCMYTCCVSGCMVSGIYLFVHAMCQSIMPIYRTVSNVCGCSVEMTSMTYTFGKSHE